MFRIAGSVLLGVCAMVLIGCGGFDAADIAMHPDTVAAGSTFDVVLINSFNYLDSTGTVEADVKRDSLHLLVGLPGSWNVLGAGCAAMNDLTKEQLAAWLNDEMGPQQLAALIQKYQAAAVPMSADAALPAAISGDTVIAHDVAGEEELEVTSASAAQWKGFSAPVNIEIKKGVKADTLVPTDSLMDMMGETMDTSMLAMLQAMGVTVPEKVGMYVRPVAVFLKVQTAAATGADTLFYFSKTGTMTKTAASLSLIPDIDTGDMVFKPIVVANPQSVRNGRAVSGAAGVTIFADRMAGTVRIDLGEKTRGTKFVDIYSLRGDLVRRLVPSASVIWNGTDQVGSRVGAGSYLVKIAGNGSVVTRSVQLMR